MSELKYYWLWEASEDMPQELTQQDDMEVAEFEGHVIESLAYDGDEFGAIDGIEFVACFPIARGAMLALAIDEPDVEGDSPALNDELVAVVRRYLRQM